MISDDPTSGPSAGAASPTLEHLLGRALGVEPAPAVGAPPVVESPPAPSRVNPARRARRRRARELGRARTGAAIGLVAALALGWIATSRIGHAGGVSSPPPTDAPAPTARATSRPATAFSGRLRRSLPAASHCRSTGPGSTARCNLAGVEVDYRLLDAVALRAAYRVGIGTGPTSPRSGPPACARGGEDERSWSRPAQPRRVAGRYACRLEQGQAAMWWKVDDRGLLAHAVAPDADLASLFSWWLSHGEP